MLFLALFIAGFTVGIMAALYIFAPESQEEEWDMQYFPRREMITQSRTFNKPITQIIYKNSTNHLKTASGHLQIFAIE